jgi:uncharacterized protein (DUF305 family)
MTRRTFPNSPRPRPATFTAAALAAILALSGCGGSDQPDNAAQSESTAAAPAGSAPGAAGDTSAAGPDGATGTPAAQFNTVDVLFVQGMIPHHRQATQMAALVKGRTMNKQILKLANAIRAAQDPEIKQMTAWLKAWGKPLPSAKVGEAHDEAEAGADTHAEGQTEDHDAGQEEEAPHAHEGQGGMMTAAQLSGLKKLKGKPFDNQFLTLMIEHHTGAVQSANQTLTRGLNPDVKKLCQAIVKSQTAEIKLMKRLLKAG